MDEQYMGYENKRPCGDRLGRTVLVLVALLLAFGTAVGQSYDPIDTSGFRDAIKHWNDRYGRDRNDPRFDPTQIVEIANNLLAFQNEDGGWPTNIDWLLAVPPDTIRAVAGRRLRRSTLDNRNIYTQVHYLSEVYRATGDAMYKEAALRGLAYIFREQRASGGWRGSDVDAITYNDDVMLGVMRLMRDIATGRDTYDWMDEATRARAQGALDRAIDATLKCQIVVDGVKTAWCQQHSNETFEAVKARSYELPAICPAESSGIVRFLMEMENPTPEIVDAVDAAVAWFDRSRIEGIRLERIEIEATRFDKHTAERDLIVVPDPDAPSLWTRFYEIETNRPFFCNRDGIKVYSLADVKQERRTGYGWYTRAPASIIENAYPAWKARLGGRTE